MPGPSSGKKRPHPSSPDGQKNRKRARKRAPKTPAIVDDSSSDSEEDSEEESDKYVMDLQNQKKKLKEAAQPKARSKPGPKPRKQCAKCNERVMLKDMYSHALTHIYKGLKHIWWNPEEVRRAAPPGDAGKSVVMEAFKTKMAEQNLDIKVGLCLLPKEVITQWLLKKLLPNYMK
jgi:hypothetical protein